jgi:type VI secretion system protein ImpA
LRTGGSGKPLVQLHAQMAAAFASDRSVPSALREAHDRATAIQALIAERVGAPRAIDLEPLLQPLGCLVEACETALGARTSGANGVAEGEPAQGTHAGAGGDIRSRQDAVQMLELVCKYMERHEPSNPAPLFIRRAQRLIQMNFVEIVKDLMPDSLSQLERLAGEIEKS